MLHGKHNQTLSVRELEAESKAREAAPYQPHSSGPHSSASPETLPQTRQRLEREERVRLRLNFRLEGARNTYPAPRPTLGTGARLIYFVFIGLWFGFVWLALGVALCLSLVGLPLGVWMLRHSGKAFALW